jgi:sulfhydrogenase subunit beta (sulfur reductase)
MSKSDTNNERWLVSQSELERWLDYISNGRELVAPRMVDGMLLYHQVAKGCEVAWQGYKTGSDYSSRPVLSAKEVFFPPTERLFTMHKSGQETQLTETSSDKEIVLFGIRSCDARGVKLLDALFLDTEPVDIHYARRRQNAILIGMACQEMGSTCFCTSMGIGPDNAQDMDIMLYKMERGYVAEVVTGKGKSLIPINEWNKTDTRPRFPAFCTQFPTPKKSKWIEHFNDRYWMELSERCLSCRACTYVCPTCRCFAVRDESIAPSEFERIRCWDACVGENYRRVAGGHRPRAEKSERLRNRFYCKFFYFPKQYGLGTVSACTGCGRCIDVCPIGVDISEVLMDLEKMA